VYLANAIESKVLVPTLIPVRILVLDLVPVVLVLVLVLVPISIYVLLNTIEMNKREGKIQDGGKE
jgi:hypothetical protein